MDTQKRLPWAWLLPLLLVGAYGLFVKYRLLDSPLGFSAVARLLSRVEAGDLVLLERLALFQGDLLLNGLVLPGLALALFWGLGRRGRVLASLILCTVLGLVFFQGREALANVGRFLTAEMAADAWAWVAEHPENLLDYLGTSQWRSFLPVWLLAVALSLVLARMGTRSLACWDRLAQGLVLGAALAVLAGQGARLPAFPQGRAVLLSMAQAWVGQARGALSASITDAELPRFFREFSRTPERDDSAPPFGRERGADVLVFVLETGPQEALDLAAEAERLAGLEQLLPHAWLSAQHYTTYPYTSDALFSLLGGIYPLNRKDYLRPGAEAPPFGLMGALGRAGYRTAVYSPDQDSFEADLAMFRVLGAQERYVAEAQAFSPAVVQTAEAEMAALPQDSTAFTKFASFTRRRFLRDRALLEQVKSDIAADRRADRRFCRVVLPQLGHAPWLNLVKAKAILPRGRDLMERQLRWLGELVEVLEREGGLDNTVIVLTADHGIRTRAEDPGFRAGSVSAYSFNVPLLIYAPHTLAGPERLSQPTSHIDLAPTLLSLLGVAEGRAQEQGVPVWEPGLDQRVLGLFAGDYLGADAYREGPDFLMREAFTGAAYRSRVLAFGPETLLPLEQQHAVGARLETWYALQARWAGLSMRR